MATFDKSFESFLNESMSSNRNNADVRVSASISTYKESNIGEKSRLLDEAISEGLGTAAKIKDGSFNNPAMGTGYSNYMMSSGYFMSNMITFNRSELTSIYHGCWIFRKIVDLVARDMWARGITINNDKDPDELKQVYGLYNKVKSDMIFSQQQARIYGGAAALMMVDDGEEDLSKPLNLKKIKQGSPINFIITDRWYGLEWSSEVVENFGSPEFGKPKYYSFFIHGQEDLEGQKVHHSRVLRFVNRRSPRMIEQQLQGWGISELEHILQDLMNHENTKNSIASLLNKALLEIVKLEGMRNTMSGLSNGNAQASQMFAAQMTALNNYRTSNKLVFMDKNDDYLQEQYSFSGLSDILISQKDIVSGAAEMPEVLLFGTNRAGLNGDNPVEMKIYANMILGKQDQEVRPVLDKLLPVLFRICGMEVPKQLSYEFETLLDISNESKQNALSNIVSNVTTLLDNGLITKETAIEELLAAQKQTGFGLKFAERDTELARRDDKLAEETPEGSELGLDEDDEEFTEETVNTPQTVNSSATEEVKKINKEGSLTPQQQDDIKDSDDDYAELKERIIRATLKDKKKYFK